MTNQDKKERFPLNAAYEFLIKKGFGEDVAQIKGSKDKYKSYSTSLRSGKIINLLAQKSLLEEFLSTGWPAGVSEKGQKEVWRCERIYDAFTASSNGETEAEDEEIESSSFVYEEHLRDFLSTNLSVIENGLSLYRDADKNTDGVEFAVDANNKRIDILAMDNKGNMVVIELKVSWGYEKVIGQCLYYKNQVRRLFPGKRVRIVIIAWEITPQLKIAVEGLPDVELFEYKLKVSLSKVT